MLLLVLKEVCYLRINSFVVASLLSIFIGSTICLGFQRAFPVVIEAPRPPYPALAAAKKISGTVLVDVQVNPDGTVINAEVIDGPELLRDICRIAARSWRFKSSDPEAVPFSVRLTFIFHDESFVPPKQKPDFTSPFQVEISRPVSQF